MQVWPPFCSAPHTAALAARSRFASSSTIIGSLPPSSSVSGRSRSAAFSASCLPTSVEPVKCSMSTCSTSAPPTSLPLPFATRNTSSGAPISRIASAISSELSGVMPAGFSTTVLPAMSAGIASPKLFTSG